MCLEGRLGHEEHFHAGRAVNSAAAQVLVCSARRRRKSRVAAGLHRTIVRSRFWLIAQVVSAQAVRKVRGCCSVIRLKAANPCSHTTPPLQVPIRTWRPIGEYRAKGSNIATRSLFRVEKIHQNLCSRRFVPIASPCRPLPPSVALTLQRAPALERAVSLRHFLACSLLDDITQDGAWGKRFRRRHLLRLVRTASRLPAAAGHRAARDSQRVQGSLRGLGGSRCDGGSGKGTHALCPPTLAGLIVRRRVGVQGGA